MCRLIKQISLLYIMVTLTSSTSAVNIDLSIKKEIIDIINIQLKDNQKARILEPELLNKYVPLKGKKYKSQEETYSYLKGKK